MLVHILRGSQMGPRNGWFGPAETRYTWQWLAEHLAGDAAAKAIAQDKFTGPEAWWPGLDRDGDGQVTPGDLDWSDGQPLGPAIGDRHPPLPPDEPRRRRPADARRPGRVLQASSAGGKDFLTVGRPPRCLARP